MKFKKTMLVALICAVAAGAYAAGKANEADSAAEAKRADIRKLMKITGAGDMGIQAMNQMLSSFEKSMPQVPAEFWKEVKAEVKPNELIELCIPAYEKHYTHEDIKQIIAFYKSPLGQKMIKTEPLIMKECYLAGEKWGRQLGTRIMKKLQARNAKKSNDQDF